MTRPRFSRLVLRFPGSVVHKISLCSSTLPKRCLRKYDEWHLTKERGVDADAAVDLVALAPILFLGFVDVQEPDGAEMVLKTE